MSSTIGQPFKDRDGIEVALMQEQYRAVYPYPCYVVNFRLDPTPRGKQSRAYQTITGILGSEWSTPLTDPEQTVDAFRAAGIPDDETESILNAAQSLRTTQPLMEYRA